MTAKPYTQLVFFGIASAALYLALYLYHEPILALCTRTDGWYPALPVATAFVFSLAHGVFASCFWEVVGISAKVGGGK